MPACANVFKRYNFPVARGREWAVRALTDRLPEALKGIEERRRVVLGYGRTPVVLLSVVGYAEPGGDWKLVLDAPVFATSRVVVTAMQAAVIAFATLTCTKSVRIDEHRYRCVRYAWIEYPPEFVAPGKILYGSQPKIGPLVFDMRVCVNNRCAEKPTGFRSYWDPKAHKIPYYPTFVFPLRGWARLRVWVKTYGICGYGFGGGVKHRGLVFWRGIGACGIYGFLVAVDDGVLGPRIEINPRPTTCLGVSEEVALATIAGPGTYEVRIGNTTEEVEVKDTATIAIPNSIVPREGLKLDLEIRPDALIPALLNVLPCPTCIDRYGDAWVVVPDLPWVKPEAAEVLIADEIAKRLDIRPAAPKPVTGSVSIEAEWPVPKIVDVEAPSTSYPMETVRVVSWIQNVGTCVGDFSVNGVSVTLEPNRLYKHVEHVRVETRPTRWSVAALVALASGETLMDAVEGVVKPVFFVEASNGVVRVVGGPGGVRVRMVMIGSIEPESASVSMVEMQAGLRLPAWVADVEAWEDEEVVVARYERLDYIRARATRQIALIVEGARVAKADDVEWSSTMVAPFRPLLRIASEPLVRLDKGVAQV